MDLIFDIDERSIGIQEVDPGGELKYIPIILYNFTVTGNISDQHDPYRGWQIQLKTTCGQDFDIKMSAEEVKTFKTFHRCVTEQTWNVDLSYIPFDEAMWSELFVRVKHSCRPIPNKKPARNWGLQVSHLRQMASKRGGKWLAEDVEDVYPGVVFDGYGNVKKNPIHVVVPKLLPIKMDVLQFEPSGLQGLLEMFLPPYTSEDPVMRAQQIVALVCILVLSFYRLIIYNIGGCPGLILGSDDPDTLKSTTIMIGTRLCGDPSHFLECTSSKESIETRQTSTSLTTFLDDSNRPQVVEDLLVGSYQGAAKSTISRGTTEKIGAFANTKNFKAGETINPKVIEGRAILLIMERLRSLEKGPSSVRDNYLKKRKHTDAMSSNRLPRDYCAAFKKHFLYKNQEDTETEIHNIHLVACELLAEVKTEYDPRRLEALALPIAIVMLIQKDVEELGQENVTRLFVDVFNDRQTFFNMYIGELNKADKVIEDMSRLQGRRPSVREEEVEIRTDEEHIDSMEFEIASPSSERILKKSSSYQLPVVSPSHCRK